MSYTDIGGKLGKYARTSYFARMDAAEEDHLVRCRRCGWIYLWNEAEPLGLLTCSQCQAPLECIDVPVHPSEWPAGVGLFYIVPPSQRHKYPRRLR